MNYVVYVYIFIWEAVLVLWFGKLPYDRLESSLQLMEGE